MSTAFSALTPIDQTGSPSPAPHLDAARVIAPPLIEPGLAALTIIIYAISLAYRNPLTETSNYIGPILLSAAVLLSAFVFVKRDINAIWTPMVWVRLAIATYFGIGAIVPFFINDDTSDLIRSFFNFYEHDVVKYNLVNAVFLLFFSVLGFFTSVILHDKRSIIVLKIGLFEPSALSQEVFGAVLIATGFTANFLVIYPIQFGLVNGSVPQTVSVLAQLPLVGYFLLINWTARTRSNLIYLILGICAFDSVMGAIQFSKFETIFPWVMAALGYFHSRITWKNVLVFFLGIGALYFAIGPVAAFGRADIASRHGADYNAPLGERIASIQAYFAGGAAAQEDNLQIGWARLSYVNAGSWAISQYDQGIPGNSWRYMPIVWIPRIIYPKKPIITDVSREFTYLVNGNYNSSTSPGLPAEAYWDFGWAGVLMCAVILNFIFSLWSIYSIGVLRKGSWHLFFVVLIGMRMGLRIDGAMVSDIIGPIGIAVMAHIVLQLSNRYLPQRLKVALGAVRYS